ncbi:hypothetical protein HU200_061649 [Digitaria exilis]|uniref:O-methyltransferase dimerisation domain-containing protein n=1 Tax=Digitaria exilis TaxID=1010633 RepID=A0A835A4F8_9POAL|nr:hypothetical protein HU200_061649 [Digitaria exilis]
MLSIETATLAAVAPWDVHAAIGIRIRLTTRHAGSEHLYHHGLSHVKSMAFGCAIQLCIPTAIYRRGGAATISDLAADTGVDPSKLPYLRRLMRVLTVSGIFAADHPPSSPSTGENETVYKLTPASRLLVGGEASTTTSCDMSPMMRLLVRPTTYFLQPAGRVAQSRRHGVALRDGPRHCWH